ncbi:MAG: SDR family oxidoreductase [Burkholderiales bacterium]|nr:SDR family oxidoreductase [Burkholderiales bacterium]
MPEKRYVLITGGSRGIGAACALVCARQGWDVAVNYTQDGAAAQSVVEQVQALGRHAVAVQADVADEAAVIAMFEILDAGLGRHSVLAGLINNAGVVDKACRVEDMTGERLQRMFAINVFGTFYATRQAVLRMSTRRAAPGSNRGRGGAVVNISSVAARLGGAGQYVDYAASKGAIDTFTYGLARELATEGVRVNGVRPGIIDTEIHASGGQPGRARQLAATIPVQRPGTAQEVAEAAAWLLSDAASYSTGAVIDVSGGRSCG